MCCTPPHGEIFCVFYRIRHRPPPGSLAHPSPEYSQQSVVTIYETTSNAAQLLSYPVSMQFSSFLVDTPCPPHNKTQQSPIHLTCDTRTVTCYDSTTKQAARGMQHVGHKPHVYPAPPNPVSHDTRCGAKNLDQQKHTNQALQITVPSQLSHHHQAAVYGLCRRHLSTIPPSQQRIQKTPSRGSIFVQP